MRLQRALLVVLMATMPGSAWAQARADATVKTLKVTVLSTMLVGRPSTGIGEWGFAAVLEADGHRILIDTGARAETVLKNVAELKVDLSDITEVVLTHNHGDHTGGLIALRREFMKKNPRALSRVHVPQGIFLSRKTPGGIETNGLTPIRAEYKSWAGSSSSTRHHSPWLRACGCSDRCRVSTRSGISAASAAVVCCRRRPGQSRTTSRKTPRSSSTRQTDWW